MHPFRPGDEPCMLPSECCKPGSKTASNGTDCRRRIGLLMLPGFQVMCFSAFSVFEVANKKAGKTIYDLHVLSGKRRPGM